MGSTPCPWRAARDESNVREGQLFSETSSLQVRSPLCRDPFCSLSWLYNLEVSLILKELLILRIQGNEGE